MKLNKYILSAGLVAMAMTSCTDLDVSVDSQYTEYPNNPIAVEAKMADVYFHLRGTYGRRLMEAMCLSSDEYTSVAFDGGYWDDGTYHNQAWHNSSSQDASLDWYPSVASGITKANKIIVDLGGNNGGAGVASPRAIRAFFHFILMDGWGDIPVLDYIPEDTAVVERMPRKQVAEWIEKELLDVIPDLTTEVSANTYGKPTRWMAEALLAKLYINWPVYTAESVDQYDAATAKNEKLADCIKICDDIINSNLFDLGARKGIEYRYKFSYDNSSKTIEDFIYAMPYDAITQQGLQYGRPRTFKDMKNLLPNYYGSTEKFSQSFGGNFLITPEFASLFCLEGDQRNNCIIGGPVYLYDAKTLLPTTEPFMYKGAQVVLSDTIAINETKDVYTLDVGNDAAAYQKGYHSVKFFLTPSDYNNGRNQSNDLPIFRYADILLTKAEAIVRGGGSGDAKGLFNQIREYVKAPLLDHTPSLKEILDERGREFLDENWRRNDLIRFGNYEDEWFPRYKTKAPFAEVAEKSGSFDKRRRIFPIHKDVLNTNKTWKQNPGY